MKKVLFLGALAAAVLAPIGAAQAQVSIRVSTPDFGIRIGAPVYAGPVYAPAPIYAPVPVYSPPVYAPPVYAPPVYAPAPVYFPAPVYVPRPRVFVPRPVIVVPRPYHGHRRYPVPYYGPRGGGPQYGPQYAPPYQQAGWYSSGHVKR